MKNTTSSLLVTSTYQAGIRKNKYVKIICQHPGLSNKFGNIINDIGLELLIESPIQIDKTLHLLCTCTPTTKDHTKILPTISDRSITLVQMGIKPMRISEPYKIILCKRANWDNMKRQKEKTKWRSPCWE